MTLTTAHARLAPIVILRSVNRDGETYALDPRSQERLRSELGSELHLRSRLFLAHESRPDSMHGLGLIAQQIIVLLTGVSEDRLRPLGGVAFRDPVTEAELPRV